MTSYIAPHKNGRDLDNVSVQLDYELYARFGYLSSSWLLLASKPQNSPRRAVQIMQKGRANSQCGLVVATEELSMQESSESCMYVRQLRKHMPIDVYGKSARYFHQPSLKEKCIKGKAFGTPDCRSLLQNYKFFLAFENMNCEDYITEKYWCTPLDLGLVSVVMGGADYDALAIPGSYINNRIFRLLKGWQSICCFLIKMMTNIIDILNGRSITKLAVA